MAHRTRTFTLYHGTPKGRAKGILKNGFNLSTSDTHWMGRGVYFYNDKALARAFVKKIYKGSTPAIIQAQIVVDSRRVLDLVHNMKHIKSFCDFVEKQRPILESSMILTDADMSDEKARDKCIFTIKCALFDWYSLLNNINLIICEHELHPGNMTNQVLSSAKLPHRSEIQYCAKVAEIITELIQIEEH